MKTRRKVRKEATREVFRVGFRGRFCTPADDYASFEEAVRAVRAVHPGVDFGEWVEYPPAGNGDRCSDLPFGIGGKTLGNLFHLRLVS